MATTHGPIFHSDAQVAGMLHEVEATVAQRGYELVASNLKTSLRTRTPYYETQVRVTHTQPGAVVHDSDVVYGPWLEGVSERNRATRFKGYFAFRRAGAQLDKEAVRIALPVVAQFVRAVN